MVAIDIQRVDDALVIHFGTAFPRINAYTLATTLTNLADAAKAANATINPGYEIEIVVEALSGGSFKAQVRALYKGAANLFSKQTAQTLILNVIAAFIYQHTLSPDTQITINVNTSEVVIEQGDTRVVVPREVHDAAVQAEKSPQFRKSIADTIRTLDEDPDVGGVGFSYRLDDPVPVMQIPRDRFAVLPRYLSEEDQDARELIEVTEVQILRAILERSKRRWEFVWNGVRIPAPVTDAAFYEDFFAHKVTIAPGDRLRVKLRIRQRRHKEARMFINEAYEVVEVLSHLPQARQQQLESPVQ